MRLLLVFILLFVVEWYSFQVFRTAFDNRWITRIYLLVSAIALIYIIYSFSNFSRSQGQTQSFLFTSGLMMLVYLPKLLMSSVLIFEDLFRLLIGIYEWFIHYKDKEQFMPERRRFVSQVALALASIPFASLVYGIIQGRYNYKVLKHTLYFDDLPDAFDGLKVMQLSDIHCGSFNNYEKIKYGIDLINEQDYDVLFFTGDIVNNFASEADDWIELFAQIKTPKYGKLAVLGNHDYGEYTLWESAAAKQKNFEAIKSIFLKIGFRLLLNENVELTQGEEKIHVVGVENWGRGFKKAGDLNKAAAGLAREDFKIVLSHDPSHWDLEIEPDARNFQLTLSGHTHGMQFGIEIPGVKWSPVQYIYKHWAGLYRSANRYLHVNRGFGYHAYPGRVGIWPEITMLELKKKKAE